MSFAGQHYFEGSMNRYRAAECGGVFLYLEQRQCESVHEYFERFQWYMDEYPDHGLPFNVLLEHFLEGMQRKDHLEMDVLAGGSIMERTPTEVWHLIQARAAATSPYAEYERLERLAREEKLRQSRARYQQMVEEYNRDLEEFLKAEYEVKSTPDPIEFLVSEEEAPLLVKDQNEGDIVDDEFGADEPAQFSVFNEEESLPLFDEPLFNEERMDEEFDEPLVGEPLFDEPLYDEEATFSLFDEEDTLPVYDEPLCDEEEQLPLYDEELTVLQVEENLQVVPVMSMEDDSAKEWSSLPCPDIILEQNLVITRNPIISPLSQLFLSYNVQNDKINEALCKNQVWDQVLGKFCINWKTRKKSIGRVQNSVKRSNNHSGDFRPALAPMKSRPNWKKRKKGKCYITNSEFSIFSVNVQKNRASFGWKPGWKLWKNASHKVARKVRKDVRKYDGIHPWAPNI